MGWIYGDAYETLTPEGITFQNKNEEKRFRSALREQFRMHKLTMDGDPTEEDVQEHFKTLSDDDKGKDAEPFNRMLELIKQFDGLRIYQLNDEILEQYPELLVMKSISKSYGVPGLRLGVLAGADTALLDKMKKDVAIWNINSFAEFYMQIFNKYESFYKNACSRFVDERNRFAKRLSAIPYLRVIPSQANYFLCQITKHYTSRQLTEKLLNDYNILIKDCDNKTGLEGKNFVRIAIRDQQDNDRLLLIPRDIVDNRQFVDVRKAECLF